MQERKHRPNERLRRARELRGWGQKDVAEKLDLLEERTIRRWETGESTPSPFYRQRLCELFEMNALELGFLEPVPTASGSLTGSSVSQAMLTAQIAGEAPVDVSQSGEQALLRHEQRSSSSTRFPPVSPNTPNTGSELVLRPTLPAPLTPLLGRQQEVATACALLRQNDVRLLVVTGLGGIGKTRLALQIATDLREDFSAGVCFIALDALRDPALVASTVLQGLGLRENASESVMDQLKSSLREQSLLLLLDNFEQIASAAPLLTDLLIACPKLKLLVTSRIRLHVQGEHNRVVPPLTVPDLQHLPEREALAQYASVALFLQQTRALLPKFQMSQAYVRAIAEICIRLEGIPLAIELAAARMTLLSPHELLARLSQRLKVLTRGAEDAPERQQTLQNTLDWSYSLLAPSEQWLFCHLSIFVGGWTLEAAEAICMDAGNGKEPRAGDVFEGMASLIDSYLLYRMERETEESRYGMLETTREYGRAMLASNEETESTRQKHARYYLALAEQAAQAWEGPLFAVWLERMERDHENLRAAMEWALERGADPERMGVALRLGSALRSFWQVRGYFREGRGFLEQVLAQSEGSHPALRAKVLNEAIHLALSQGNAVWGEALCQENLARCRELGDGSGMARALYLLGLIDFGRGNLARASAVTEECLATAQEVGDQVGILMAHTLLGFVTLDQGEYARAQALSEQALAIQRKLANKRGIAWSLTILAWALFLSQRDPTTAGAFLAEARALFQELGDKWGMAECCWRQGRIALDQADVATARLLLEQSLTLFREIGNRKETAHTLCLLGRLAVLQQDWASARTFSEEGLKEAQAVNDAVEIVFCMEGIAGVAAAEQASSAMVLWAAQLWGAAEAVRERIGAPLPPAERRSYERSVAAARNTLGKQLFAASWAEGRTMTPEQAQVALGQELPPAGPVREQD